MILGAAETPPPRRVVGDGRGRMWKSRDMSTSAGSNTSHTGGLMSTVLLPGLVSVIVSVTTAVSIGALTTAPNVENEQATEFLTSYYSDVTADSVDREEIWLTRQSKAFRTIPGHDQDAFDDFYTNDVSEVEVGNVSPGATANQFVVSLRFTARATGKDAPEESHVFWLKCTDLWSRLPLINCPVDKIQIDVVTDTSAADLMPALSWYIPSTTT